MAEGKGRGEKEREGGGEDPWVKNDGQKGNCSDGGDTKISTADLIPPCREFATRQTAVSTAFRKREHSTCSKIRSNDQRSCPRFHTEPNRTGPSRAARLLYLTAPCVCPAACRDHLHIYRAHRASSVSPRRRRETRNSPTTLSLKEFRKVRTCKAIDEEKNGMVRISIEP